MRLCVGAVTRRVVEEAARLQVAQIVASRAQVDLGCGYIGLAQDVLAQEVERLSQGRTQVVRDHGGPGFGRDDINWRKSLDADLHAGFNGLHVDVSKLERDVQLSTWLSVAYEVACTGIRLELGGERDDQQWLFKLLWDALKSGYPPDTCIIQTGAHIWAERQRGYLCHPGRTAAWSSRYHNLGVATKAHNFDWVGGRDRFSGSVDFYNVAPELAQVEVDAWLMTLKHSHGVVLLGHAYDSGMWGKWFAPGEGTVFDRARCAARYVLETPAVRRILDGYDDTSVRLKIRDAINHG